jgi:Holliday junction resolvasome RuvABC ATP-dependent DNA helicase subunit
MDELLNKFGIDRDSLNSQEAEILDQWSKQLNSMTLGVKDIENYISQMILALEKELLGYDTPKTFTTYIFRGRRLKNIEARLYNYLLLKDFLTAPQKARDIMEKQILNLKKT